MNQLIYCPTQVCLISDQAAPNLLPLLDQDLRPKRTIFVVSKAMKQRAGNLADVVRVRGVRVEYWPIDKPWQLEHVQDRILELLEKEGADPITPSIALNATGGTKIMSMAALEAFHLYKQPVFYVHPERDEVRWLNPRNHPVHKLKKLTDISAYLQAHGARVQGDLKCNVPVQFHDMLEIGQQLIADIERFSSHLSTFNWLASSASKNQELKSDPVKNDQGDLALLIDLFEQKGYLRREQGCLRFSNEEARFLANGGWLELLVFDVVRQIGKKNSQIQAWARSVEIDRSVSGKSVKNELDVVFLCNNRLHIIECKTAKMPGESEDAKGPEPLYKLDTLKELTGGLQTRGMLISYHDLSGHIRVRAGDLRISLCGGRQLRELRHHISQFITPT